MKIKITELIHRKIKNQLAVKTIINVEREDGSTHLKSFVTFNPNISKAKRIAEGQAKMFLRNITQKATLVQLP